MHFKVLVRIQTEVLRNSPDRNAVINDDAHYMKTVSLNFQIISLFKVNL